MSSRRTVLHGDFSSDVSIFRVSEIWEETRAVLWDDLVIVGACLLTYFTCYLLYLLTFTYFTCFTYFLTLLIGYLTYLLTYFLT